MMEEKAHNAVDHSGHRARLKRALRENGLSSFASHEVIEILLYSALPRRDVNELAHRLDDTFGGIEGLLKADMKALMEKGGLSENTAQFITAVGGCVRAYAEKGIEGKVISTLKDAQNCLTGGRVMALLSSGRRVIFTSVIPETDGDKFIFTRALIYDAAGVIVMGAHFEGLKESLALTGTEYTEI